jgi:hypothetical protein
LVIVWSSFCLLRGGVVDAVLGDRRDRDGAREGADVDDPSDPVSSDTGSADDISSDGASGDAESAWRPEPDALSAFSALSTFSAFRSGLVGLVGLAFAASLLLRSSLSRPHAGPQPGLTAHPTEQAGPRLLDHVEFGLVGAHAELVQRCLSCGLDGLGGGFDPLHAGVSLSAAE